LRRGATLSLLMLAPFASAAPAAAQPAQAPRDNFDVAVNSMALFCPALVSGRSAPDQAAGTPFGLRPINAPAGEYRFESLFSDGNVQIWFEPATHRCTVNFAGPAFHSIAGAARDIVVRNRFTSVLHDDTRPGVVGDVYDRTMSDPARRERFIIGEDSTSQTAALSYSERTIP